MELPSVSDGGSNEHNDVSGSSTWYHRKTLVKEVFYVQSLLVFIVVISSIVNIARELSDCDKQVWLLMLSSGIAHMLPSPSVGKNPNANNFTKLTSSDSGSRVSPKYNFGTVWYKRTSQHREIFYVQAILIFIVVLSSIVFLSIGIGDKNLLIVLLSASFAHFLPGPSFIQSKSTVE